jgi:hypothetical protein
MYTRRGPVLTGNTGDDSEQVNVKGTAIRNYQSINSALPAKILCLILLKPLGDRLE